MKTAQLSSTVVSDIIATFSIRDRGRKFCRPGSDVPVPIQCEGKSHRTRRRSSQEHVVLPCRLGDRVLLPLYSHTWGERVVVSFEWSVALPPEADVQQLAMLWINRMSKSRLPTQKPMSQLKPNLKPPCSEQVSSENIESAPAVLPNRY
jgi:hypothetical protein